MDIVINKSNLSGKLNINSSKSIAHRAILSALVTMSDVTIKNINLCDDVENTIDILRQITEIKVDKNKLTIKPIKEINIKEIYIEESLSTFNFFLPFLSYYSQEEIVFHLGERLAQRVGKEFGSLYLYEKDMYFIKDGNDIRVKGFPLRREMRISNQITSQCVSGIMFLMATSGYQHTIITDSPNSMSYIDETIAVLNDFGVIAYRNRENIFVMHNQENARHEYIIPDDGSDYIVKAAINHIFKDTELPKINCFSVDPDYKLAEEIVKNKFKLPEEVDLADNPDAIFALVLLATRKKTPTKFINIARLANKESNRIETTREILVSFGFEVETTDSSLIVYPGKGQYGEVDSHNDHRVVQLAAVLASLYGGKITNAECVSKSTPHFFEDLKENGLDYTKNAVILSQNLENEESEIVFSESETKIILNTNQKRVVVTDKNLYKLYDKEINKLFPKALVYVVSGAGEKAKSIVEYEKLCSFLVKNGIAKDDYLIAFGGGTITDLVGFTTTTYKRGMNMISVPTSLIAMADAAIGFKTALNVETVKNVVGSYVVPKQIAINTKYLETLPEKEIKSGLAEIIKIFALRDKKYFYKVFMEDKDKNLSKWILEAIKLKLELVNQDPYDKGIRHALNFGHTYGHAFELIENIPHGEAVAKGMRMYTDSKELNEVLNKYKFKTPTKEQIDEAKKFIINDKKIEKGVLKVVKVHEIGDFEIVEERL